MRYDWDACLQTLEGHEEQIYQLVCSPDNTKLASYSCRAYSKVKGGTVKMWDRATGACLQSLTFNNGDHHAIMAFSPDSSQLALILDNVVKMLDVNTRACVMTLDNGSNFKSMMFSPDGTKLILSNELWEDGKFRIWDLTTRMQLQKEDYYQGVGEPAVFHLDAPDKGEITVIRSPITGSRVQVVSKDRPQKVVFTLDGMHFALKFKAREPLNKHSVSILNAATGKCLQQFTLDFSDTKCLALSPSGTQLATTYLSENIRIWNVKTGALLCEFSGFKGHNLSMAFSPDGIELLSSANEQIKIWDLTLGSSMDLEYEEPMMSVTYSPDSTRLALITNCYEISDPLTIEIWDPVAGICQQELQVGRATSRSELFRDVAQLAFSPDNTQLAYSRRNEIAIRDLTANPQQNRFEFTVSGSIQSIIFSPCGTRIAVADIPLLDQYRNKKTPKIETPKIEIWDAANGTIVYTFYFAVPILDVYFSSDGKRLGSLSREGIAAVWDLNTSACLQTVDCPFGYMFRDMRDIEWQEQHLVRTKLQFFIINMLQNPGSKPGTIHEFDISSNDKWLLRRGEPFLWLPLEYRFESMTFAGGNIAFILSLSSSYHWGTLRLFSFSLAELDAEMASNKSSILKV